MAEELNNPASTPAKQNAAEARNDSSTGGNHGDIPMLLENVGTLIDSTIESVSDMLTSATNVTGQIIENVNVTVQSDAVQGIMKNIGSVSEKVAENLNATLNAQQLKDSLTAFGKVLDNISETISSTVNSEPIQNLFETINSGINQLMGNLAPQDGSCCPGHPKAVQIPYSHNKPVKTPETPTTQKQEAPSKPQETMKEKAAAAPKQDAPAQKASAAQQEKPALQTRTEPMRSETSQEAYITLESSAPSPEKKEEPKTAQKPQGKNQNRKGKFDPSRKGTFPRSKGRQK